MAIKDRFEGIVNDGAMTESEAVKTCITYARELQVELKKLKENQKVSKLDKLLDTYVHWCRNYDPAGMVVGHVVGGLSMVGMLWLLVLLGDYGLVAYKEAMNTAAIEENYYMQGDSRLIESKDTPCFQIMFQRVNGATNRAAPCIVNRDEAFSVMAQLQELHRNGKPQTKPEPSPSEATPGR